MTRHLERATHIVIGDYLRAVLPMEAVNTLHHIANGENRSAKTGALLKRMGVKPGWPDYGWIYDGRYYGLEIKVYKDPIRRLGKTYQNNDQRDCERWIVTAGGFYAVVRHTDEVRELLAHWGIPTRESRCTARSEAVGVK